MSQITQIRNLASAAAKEASTASAMLSSLKTALSQQEAQINSSIQGTSTGADKDAIDAINQAQKGIADAIEALRTAVNEINKWSRSL